MYSIIEKKEPQYSKCKKCSVFMEPFEFCKNRSKVEHTANVLYWNDRFSNT